MRDDAAMDEDEERNVGDEVQEVHHASHLPVELGQHLQYTCTLHQQVHSNFATAYSTRAPYVSNTIQRSPLPAGFRGRKALLNRASALVTTCP